MRRFVLFGLAAFAAMLVSGELALSLPILGIGPDLVILVVAVFSIGERPRAAAVAGFCAGLGRDLLLSTPKGLSAFSYAITAYVVAQIGVGSSRRAWALIGTVASATFASQLMYGLGAVLFGPQADASPIPRVVLVTTAYNALVTPLLMPLLRRVIQSESAALPGD